MAWHITRCSRLTTVTEYSLRTGNWTDDPSSYPLSCRFVKFTSAVPDWDTAMALSASWDLSAASSHERTNMTTMLTPGFGDDHLLSVGVFAEDV